MSHTVVHTRYLASHTDLYGNGLTGSELSSHNLLLRKELNAHQKAEKILVLNRDNSKRTKIIYAIACVVFFFIIPLSYVFYAESKLAKGYEDLYNKKLTIIKEKSSEIAQAIIDVSGRIITKEDENRMMKKEDGSEKRKMDTYLESLASKIMYDNGYRTAVRECRTDPLMPTEPVLKISKGSMNISLEEYQKDLEIVKQQIINEISFSY